MKTVMRNDLAQRWQSVSGESHRKDGRPA
jgi:hypothetical protein